MAQTRDLFEGYYFEHLWTTQQDNGQRDYREAVNEIRQLRLLESTTIRHHIDLVESAGRDDAPRYRFVTTCVDTHLNGPYGEAIHDMKRARHGILDFDDIMSLIGPAELARAGLDPSTLADDFAVSWEQSVWRGIPCIYIVQSGIEHIFTPEGQTPGPWVDEEEEA